MATNYQFAVPYAEAILDSDGNLRTSTACTIKTLAGVAAQLYANRDKTLTLSNPRLTTSIGNLAFYVDPGIYTITIGSDVSEPFLLAMDPQESQADESIDVRDYGAVGDDATDDTDAFLAAIAAIPTTGGALSIPPDFTMLITDDVDLGGTTGVQRNNRHIVGSGASSIIHLIGTRTNGLRLLNSSNSSIRDLHITAPSTIINALHVTTDPNSTEVVLVENVFIEGGANCFVVGGDTANDVSEITFVGCDGSGAANAAFKLGNGTAANVIDIRMFGCVARNSVYGVHCDGSAYSWHGGTALGNSTEDFHLGSPGSGPILIEGVRSEGSRRLWGYTGSGTLAISVTLLGVEVASYTDAAGKVVVHNASAPLTMIGCSFVGGPVPVAMDLSANASFPLVLTAINVATDATDNPFGTSATVIRNVVGLRKIDGSGQATEPYASTTPSAYFGHVAVGTDTMVSAEQLHTLGANNANAGIIVQDLAGSRALLSPSNGGSGRPFVGSYGSTGFGIGTAATEQLQVSTAGVFTFAAATEVVTAASATAHAGLNIPHGAAPTSPVNGDVWTTTAGLFVRVNGSTIGPLS